MMLMGEQQSKKSRDCSRLIKEAIQVHEVRLTTMATTNQELKTSDLVRLTSKKRVVESGLIVAKQKRL